MTPEAYLESLMSRRPLEGVTYPHCEWRVLHSPGACCICDKYGAEMQRARQAAGILFTDDLRNAELVERFLMGANDRVPPFPCPAYAARGEACQYWMGNTPKPAGWLEGMT